jgi:hypothetical protein
MIILRYTVIVKKARFTVGPLNIVRSAEILRQYKYVIPYIKLVYTGRLVIPRLLASLTTLSVAQTA